MEKDRSGWKNQDAPNLKPEKLDEKKCKKKQGCREWNASDVFHNCTNTRET